MSLSFIKKISLPIHIMKKYIRRYDEFFNLKEKEEDDDILILINENTKKIEKIYIPWTPFGYNIKNYLEEILEKKSLEPDKKRDFFEMASFKVMLDHPEEIFIKEKNRKNIPITPKKTKKGKHNE